LPQKYLQLNSTGGSTLFIIFQGQKDHDDEQIKKAQEFIEKNFQEKITVDQLASMFAIGRRNPRAKIQKGYFQHGCRIYPTR
jgi:transcriptional regulator GlxA family with amidase domain